MKFSDKLYEQSEKGKARKKRYRQSEKGKLTIKCYQQTEKQKALNIVKTRRYELRYPERKKARWAIKNAINRDKIPSPCSLKCTSCSMQAEHYHHPNGYKIEHRLDVIPVCRKCHRIIHNH